MHPYQNNDCRRSQISGFEKERKLSEEVISSLAGDNTVMVAMGIKENKFLYGHSNTKIEADDPANWKMIRSVEEVNAVRLFAAFDERFNIKFQKVLCVDEWSFVQLKKLSSGVNGATICRVSQGSNGDWSIDEEFRAKKGIFGAFR